MANRLANQELIVALERAQRETNRQYNALIEQTVKARTSAHHEFSRAINTARVAKVAGPHWSDPWTRNMGCERGKQALRAADSAVAWLDKARHDSEAMRWFDSEIVRRGNAGAFFDGDDETVDF